MPRHPRNIGLAPAARGGPLESSKLRRLTRRALAATIPAIPLAFWSAALPASPAHAASPAATPTPAVATPTLVWQKVLPNALVKLSSPNVATLDSGGPAMVVGAENGQIFALHLSNGSTVPGWPVQTGRPIDSSPSVAPLGPGGLDNVYIGIGNSSTAYSSGEQGGYVAYGPSGNRLWYQPGPWPNNSSAAVQASLAVGNVAANRHPDVTAGEIGQEIYSLSAASGAVLPGWPYPTADSVYSSPALAHLSSGGGTDIVSGGDQTAGSGNGKTYHSGGTLRALNGSGKLLWHFLTNQVIDSSPAVGDLANNGQQDIVFGTGFYYSNVSDTNKLFVLSSTGQLKWSANLGASTWPSPTLADLTGNGQLDVVEPTFTGTNQGFVYAFNSSGQLLSGFPVNPAPGRFIDGQVTTADLANNGQQDLLVPTPLGLFAYGPNGGAPLFNLGANQVVMQNSALVTQDPNGTLGITIVGQDPQQPSSSLVQHYELHNAKIGSGGWPQFRHDPRLTGNMSPPALSVLTHNCSTALPGPVIGLAPEGNGQGYWMANSKGSISECGGASFLGSLGGHAPSPVVALSPTSGGNGYYMVTAAGNVYNFGDAKWFGSTANIHLPSPVVGFSPLPNGTGYYLTTAAGNVYNFGSAPWQGSLVGRHLPAVAGVAATANGYYLATANGSVFNFGGAPWKGSAVNDHIPAPITAITASPGGYYLATTEGNVYSFGLPYYGGVPSGDAGTTVNSMSMAGTTGYRLTTSSGAVFDFGSATYWGTSS